MNWSNRAAARRFGMASCKPSTCQKQIRYINYYKTTTWVKNTQPKTVVNEQFMSEIVQLHSWATREFALRTIPNQHLSISTDIVLPANSTSFSNLHIRFYYLLIVYQSDTKPVLYVLLFWSVNLNDLFCLWKRDLPLPRSMGCTDNHNSSTRFSFAIWPFYVSV